MGRMRLKKAFYSAFFFFSLYRWPVDQKGSSSSRRWRVQTNGCHVRRADKDRASPTQRTQSRAPVMILSSSHRRKEHPATGPPPKHTHAHLRRDTLAHSPQSSSFTLQNSCVAAHGGIYESPKGWESSAILSGVNEDCICCLHVVFIHSFSHFTPAP